MAAGSEPPAAGGLRGQEPQQPDRLPAGGCGVRPDSGCASAVVRAVWVQIAADPMTTPDQTPDTELEVQELTDEQLEKTSGGQHGGHSLPPLQDYYPVIGGTDFGLGSTKSKP